jgi:hypothetical protein
MPNDAAKCPDCGLTYLVKEGCRRCGQNSGSEVMPDEVGFKKPSGEQFSKDGEEPTGPSPIFQLT